MKSIALSAILALGIGSAAHAKTVNPDTLLFKDTLENASTSTEIGALEDYLDLTPGSLELDFRLEDAKDLTYTLADNEEGDVWFVDVAPSTPGWFILKFGGGENNTFFFENNAEFSILAFSNADVDGRLSNCGTVNDDGSTTGNPTSCNLSHVTAVVPLPAGAILLITALGGLGIAARRRRKSS